MFYTYILISKDGLKTYTGSTSNLERRLLEHNDGKNRSSNPYAPYKIAHYEMFVSLKEARQRERFYKSTTGRRKLKVLIMKWKADKNFS